MSGIEAAASLFGSEDPSPDPFTTLGTDNASTNPFNELFIGTNGAPSGTSDSNIFDDSASTKDTIYSEYPVQQNWEDMPDLQNHSQRHVAGQNSSTSWAQVTESHTTNSTAEPPASLSTTEYSHAHGFHEYAPRVANTKQLPVAASTYGNNYTPQSYAPTSTYAPYTPYKPPTHSNYPAPTPTNLPPSKYRPPPSTNMAYPPAASVDLQPPPHTSSIVTRPKLTNAYDPPFLLSTKPTRRTGRLAADAPQTYNIPKSPAPYTSETALPNAYAGTDYQRNTPLRKAVSQGSSDISSVPSYSAGPPAGSKAALYQTNAYISGAEMSAPHESYPEHVASSSVRSNGDGTPYNPDRKISSPETCSHTPRNSSIGSNSSLPTSEKSSSPSRDPSNTSPSMVPLPYSPPGPPVQAASETSSHKVPLAKTSSQYSPHVSPQLSRRPLNNDASTTRNSNYIPRTASPLQNQYLPSESGKVPAVLNLHGVGATPYNTAQRDMTLPFTLPESDPGFHTSADGLSPRHAIGLHESTRKFSSGQYAPSPSLVGANDPLSRTSSRAPVVTFGFGGKMITCFRDMPGLNAGFDVALSARTSSELKVRILQKVLPESVLNPLEPSYPGPLVSDPGTASLTLVRSASSSQAKAKKSGLTTYLLGRVEEISQGLGFLSPLERKHAENKLILVKLLKVLVENDGRFFGSPQAESAVRTSLVPRLAVEPVLQDGVSIQAAAYQTAHLDETPISVTSLRTASLSKIEEFLLQGNRRQAFQYAVDQKLWAHAMIIASSIDKDAWKEVVNDFLRQELTLGDEQARGPHATPSPSSKKTWESLRVAYSFFSGQGAAAVREFAPPNLLSRSAGMFQPIAPPISVTPRTPNFGSMQPVLNIRSEKLSKWAETVAMMISSPFTPSPEMNGILVALGDQLLANNWIEAAHACYLLSPYVFSSQPPIINGFGIPGTRITLLGSCNPGNVFKDPDSLIFSEILEFAALLPTAKGQEQFFGLPHLQAYRFVRAVWLAEMGDVQLASRYCEAITASLSPTSPYTNSALLEQLNGLRQRISGVFEKSNSWISSKLTKPSLDTIGGWLEGRFTKLVTGDNDSSSPSDDHSKTSDQQLIGPFAHYSTISSTAPSSRSSPQPTAPTPNQLPPPPTNSAMSNQYGLPTTPSSIQPKPHLQSSATSAQLSSSQSPPTTLNGYSVYSRDGDPPRSPDSLDTPVAGGWWSGGANGATTKTPTAATFLSVQGDMVQASSDGFISLMDNQSFAFESKPPSRQATSFAIDTLDDEEDLGLGNSNPKPRAEKEEEEQTRNPAQENKSLAEKPPENTPAPGVANSGGSWFGRFFRRSDNASTGPVKANLGEEKSLYYDKELKRWINKGESVSSAPLPPPARAQTASPGLSASKAPPPPLSGLAPPRAASAGVDGPPRPGSAIDLTAEPATKVPPRIRSNLAPPETISGPPLSPSSTPPPVRPRSQAAKRNVRNRYVDVFQQDNGGQDGAS